MTHTPTTACICSVTNPRFQDEFFQENPDKILMDVNATFNGISSEMGYAVTFSRTATMAQKQTAVRAVVNQLVQVNEPTVTLSSADIQIIGLPV